MLRGCGDCFYVTQTLVKPGRAGQAGWLVQQQQNCSDQPFAAHRRMLHGLSASCRSWLRHSPQGQAPAQIQAALLQLILAKPF